jgi:hypothetical protein
MKLPGSNYGWPVTEGPTSDPRFRGPIFAYRHGSGSTTGCAIVGGGFYNPTAIQFPVSYVGKYFFADLCNGWIRTLDPSNGTAADFATGISFPVDLDLLPCEDSSSVKAQAEDALHNIYPLTVEFVGKIPGFDLVTEVIVRLPDNLPANQDVLVSVTRHASTSNKARIKIK